MARLLIVEDDPAVARLIARSAESVGLEPLLAGTVPAALEIVRTASPDAVVLDIGLPGHLDGRDVLSRLGREGPPVWVYSGRDDPYTVELCSRYGARRFWPKSTSARVVVDAVRREIEVN